MRTRRRAFALADYVAGIAVFSGALLAFSGLTRSKFTVLGEAGAIQVAQSELEGRLDALRAEGLSRAPAGEADARGFQVVTRRERSLRGIGKCEEVVAARPLTALLAQGQRSTDTTFFEVRVSLSWQGGQLELSGLTRRGGL